MGRSEEEVNGSSGQREAARSLFRYRFRCAERCGPLKQNEMLLLLLLSHFSRVRLCNLIDGSPPGSAVPGILQARTLEWVAISFSNA